MIGGFRDCGAGDGAHSVAAVIYLVVGLDREHA